MHMQSIPYLPQSHGLTQVAHLGANPQGDLKHLHNTQCLLLSLDCRKVVGTAVLGNGQHLQGSSPATQAPLGPLPLIYGQDAAVDATSYAANCETDSLNETLVKGHIVVSITTVSGQH